MRQLLVLIPALVFAGLAHADEGDTAPVASGMVEVSQEPTVDLDAKSLAADFAKLFRNGMAEHHIPGAVLMVLYNGKIVCQQGHGFANLAAKTPVDPNETLFRIGSVSKLVTATGVMRLVEQGLLDLHAPINTYLRDFQVPDYEGTPITLWHLLTHTAGFDERFLDICKPSPDELEPTGAFLARRLPPIVTPPGSVMNYSNFGMTLAAHVAECASGQPFSLYIDDSLMVPLGIARGGFDQPLPPDRAARLAENYTFDGRTFVPSPWSIVASQIYPSGLYAVTGADIAKFMQFHLDFGRIGARRYMHETTIRDMQRVQFRNHPDLVRGHGLGFQTRMQLDHPIVWHTGLTENFTAQLVLAPQDNAGFFIACNSAAGGRLFNDAFQVFARHFLRTGNVEQPEVTQPDTQATSDLDYVGTYRQVRRVRSTLLKFAFFGNEIRLVPDRQHGLLQWGSFNTPASLDGDQWRPIEPGVYGAIRSKSPRRMAFRRDDNGTIRYAFVESDSFSVADAFERLSWYETTRFHIFLHSVCMLVFASMLVRLVRRWRLDRLEGTVETRPADTGAWGRRVGSGIVCLNLLFVAGMGLYISTVDLFVFVLGIPLVIKLLLVLPLLSLVGTIGLTAIVVEEWRRRAARNFARIHTMVTALACWAFLWSLGYWRLLGYWTG